MKNKKISIIIAVFTIIAGCTSRDDKSIVRDFLENTVMKPSNDISKLNTFLKGAEDSLKTGTDTYNLIQFNIQFLRNEINSPEDTLAILSYEEFKNKEEFVPYNIVYENKDRVYCVVQGSHFITPILIDEDGKIIAFFTGIVKNKHNIVPHSLQ